MPGHNTKAQQKYNVSTDFPHLGLHSAAVSGNIGLVQYALSHGQPPNAVLNGVLPLHAACTGGSELVVRTLLAAGADPNAPRLPRRYSNNSTSNSGSSSNKSAADIKVGVAGSTPLHFAAAGGHSRLIELLLRSGADPRAEDKNGIRPVQVAEGNGHQEAASILRDALAASSNSVSLDSPETEEAALASTTPTTATPTTPTSAPPINACPTPRIHLKRSLDNLLHSRSKSSPHSYLNSPLPPLPTPRRSSSPPPLPSSRGITLPHINEAADSALDTTSTPASSPTSTTLNTPTTPIAPSGSGTGTPTTMRSPSKPPTTSPRPSPSRRPRSAGQGSERSLSHDGGWGTFPSPSPTIAPPGATTPTSITSGRLHKLSSKYSLRNLFKRSLSDAASEDLPDTLIPPVPPRASSDSSPTPSPNPEGLRSRVSSASSGSSSFDTSMPMPLPAPSEKALPAPPVSAPATSGSFVGIAGRPRKGSEVTAPSPLATVTSWAAGGQGEEEKGVGKGDITEEEQEMWNLNSKEVKSSPREEGRHKRAASGGGLRFYVEPVERAYTNGSSTRAYSHSSGSNSNDVWLDDDAATAPSTSPPPPNSAASVSSLSEAQELVRITQKAVLEGGAEEGALEERLAAYGESLALEREWAERARREEEVERGHGLRGARAQLEEQDEENARGGRRVLGAGVLNGKARKDAGPVLLTYDPPVWLLDNIAARRAGSRSPPSLGVVPLPPHQHQYQQRARVPPALQLAQQNAHSAAHPQRRPPHRRHGSSSSRSGRSGYSSVLELDEEEHDEENGVGGRGVKSAGGRIEIVRTQPTPVNSPGAREGRAGFSPGQGQRARDFDEEDERGGELYPDEAALAKGLTASPSSQTLVALAPPASRLSPSTAGATTSTSTPPDSPSSLFVSAPGSPQTPPDSSHNLLVSPPVSPDAAPSNDIVFGLGLPSPDSASPSPPLPTAGSPTTSDTSPPAARRFGLKTFVQNLKKR